MCYHTGMAKVAPEIKERMLACGTWKDFSRFRENAQKEGETPAAAMRLAVAKFCPDLAGIPPVPHRKGECAKAAEVPVKKRAMKKVAEGLMEMTGVSLAMFDGKKCTMVEALDWVIDALALDQSQVKPDTAPAAKAWSLYLMCRRSPAFAEDVISKAVVRQIPNGMREEDNGSEVFAGEREYDMLAAMREEGVA